MILREHYAESLLGSGGEDGNLLTLDYTATATPETETLGQLLLSFGTLFTVTTPTGEVLPLLRKETIELEGVPGGGGQITVRIRYVQRAEDLSTDATVVAVPPAPLNGNAVPDFTPSPIALPLLSHHWKLKVTNPYVAPVSELRCTGTCQDTPDNKALLETGLDGTILAVATPQFGILAGMVNDRVDFEPIPGGGGMLKVTLVWRSLYSDPDPADFPLVEIRCATGLTPGSCTLTKSLRGTPPTLSQNLGDALNFEGIFQGTVVNIDRYGSAGGLYTASVTARDARWEMAAAIIGSTPGSTDAGAAANAALRGYEWVFNRGGLPDKAPSGPTFQEGNGSVFWAYGDILSALTAAYMPAAVTALPDWGGLTNADQLPGEIDLRGRDLRSAVDSLLAQIGYTWTLRYDSSGTTLYPFQQPDGTVSVPIGSLLANPLAAATAKRAETLQDAYTETEALSAPALCQCGFASGGTGGITGLANLTVETLGDSEFAYEYRPDFSAISGLFPFVADRPSGSRGYPLHHDLAVRLIDGTSTYTAARASGTPGAASASLPTTSYFWVTWDALDGAWRRVVGGIELRLHPSAVRVRRQIAIYSSDATQQMPKVEQVRPLDHAGFQIAGTLAFVSDYRVSATASGAAVAGNRSRVLTQRQIVPAFAATWVGDAFDAGNLNGYQVIGGATTLVSVDAQLQAIAAAAQAAQIADRVQGEAKLDYWPDAAAVGKTLSLDGGLFGGDAGMITEAVFRRSNRESCTLRSSNQPVSSAQGRMKPVEAAKRHFLNQLASAA